MINGKPAFNYLRLIIRTNYKLSSALITNSVHCTGFIFGMIGSTAFAAKSATAQSLHNIRIRNLNVDNPVYFHTHIVKSLCLCNCTGKSVKNKSILTVILFQTLLNDADHNLVRNQ